MEISRLVQRNTHSLIHTPAPCLVDATNTDKIKALYMIMPR